MRLSLCIATYNEEKNIHYPLDSVYDLVDEVIIVDGRSTDKTVEIVKSYGKKILVFIEDNPSMFHINKQKAIERARGDWILQLDADEELSDELKKEIIEIVHRNNQLPISNYQINSKSQIQKSVKPSEVEEDPASAGDGKTSEVKGSVAYWIPRKNFFLTRFLTKGGQYPDYTIRLYRNGYAKFPCKTVHENVEVKGEIGYLKNPILHHADPDFSRYLKRWDRYTTLEAEQLLKNFQLPTSLPCRQAGNFQLLFLFVDYFILKPAVTFFSMYFRHLGFLDGFPGFVFALFSSIRFWAIYTKKWSLTNKKLIK